MISYINRILYDKSLIQKQGEIISEAFFNYRKTRRDILTEILEWFRWDHPELTEEEITYISNQFLSKIEKILK